LGRRKSGKKSPTPLDSLIPVNLEYSDPEDVGSDQEGIDYVFNMTHLKQAIF
jgi:hypothetical protein